MNALLGLFPDLIMTPFLKSIVSSEANTEETCNDEEEVVES